MAVISVEVTDEIAKKFTPFSVVSIDDLKQEIYDDDDGTYVSLIDFGPKGMSKKDFDAYKSRRNNG